MLPFNWAQPKPLTVSNIKNTVQIHTDSIVLDSGQSIYFERKVLDAIKFKDFLIVLTDPTENRRWNNENVFGYSINGELIWQIEELDLFHENHDYTAIYFEDQELCLYNRCGVEVKINPATGAVLSKELIKWYVKINVP